MPYIDYDFYTNEFKGVSLDENTFSSIVDRASDLIDIATNDKIGAIGFENLYPSFQLRVKKAIAAQVEYIHVNGGIEAIQSQEMQQVSIGDFSYSKSTSKAQSAGVSIHQTICPVARDYLRGTGLLYTGVMTIG